MKHKKEIKEIKELIENYTMYDHITVDYDKYYNDIDTYCVTVQDTDANSYQIKKSTYKEKVLQIDKTINSILKVDKENEMCYDMYRAVYLLINERNNLIRNSAFGAENNIPHASSSIKFMCMHISDLYKSGEIKKLKDGTVILEISTNKFYCMHNGMLLDISLGE